MPVDSVRTDEASMVMLGSIMDPVFGATTAGFYTQLKLSTSAHSFGDNPVLDSLVLSLDYEGIYGDSTAQITLRVFEMADSINYDSSYYSHETVECYPQELLVHTFVPNLTDSLVADGDTLPPHLRVDMTTLGQSLAEKLLAADTNQMANNDSFLKYFYGLYITAEVAASGGSILYIAPVSTLSRMTLYYHNDEEDSLSFGYNTTTSTARFSHFVHDYSLGSPEFRAQVIDGDTSLGKQICYNQTMAGVKTFIRFPFIRNYYIPGNAAVNEARLFISAVTETGSVLSPAEDIVLVRADGEGGYTILQDQAEGIDYYGGVYDDDKQGYWFRITYTVQDLMRSTDPDHGMELFISGGSINAQRLVMAGPSPVSPIPAENRMKLVITYTRPAE